MRENERIKMVTGSVAEILTSFHRSVQENGDKIWTVKTMRNLSFYDALVILGQNNIRFYHDNSERKREKEKEEEDKMVIYVCVDCGTYVAEKPRCSECEGE